MNRREFIAAASGLIALPLVGCPSASQIDQTTLAPTPSVPGLLTAQVNLQQLAQAVAEQECPEWCWAACVSMVFNFYGHPVDQTEIVIASFGTLVCAPSGSTTTIGRALTVNNWRDDRGVPFVSRVVQAYDPFNGINTFNNQIIVDELKSNNVLLYCNTSHAMLLYSVQYFDTPFGPNIQAATVIDPFPTSPRSHLLSVPELLPEELGGQMTFLAAVQIT